MNINIQVDGQVDNSAEPEYNYKKNRVMGEDSNTTLLTKDVGTLHYDGKSCFSSRLWHNWLRIRPA